MNLTGAITEHLQIEANSEGLIRQEETSYTECIKIDRRKVYSLLNKKIADSDSDLAQTEKHVKKIYAKVIEGSIKHQGTMEE